MEPTDGIYHPPNAADSEELALYPNIESEKRHCSPSQFIEENLIPLLRSFNLA
jgi:hypothetical protein